MKLTDSRPSLLSLGGWGRRLEGSASSRMAFPFDEFQVLLSFAGPGVERLIVSLLVSHPD